MHCSRLVAFVRKRAYLLAAGIALPVGLIVAGVWGAYAHEMWPPIELDLSIQRDGNIATATVWVNNIGDDDIETFTLRAQVPKGAKYLDSYAGAPGSNPGGFDGNDVGWVNDGVEAMGSQGPFVYRFDVSNLDAATSPSILAWIKWVSEEPGTAVSESVGVFSTVAPVRAGDAALGSVIYAQNCQACHAPGAAGGFGPPLKGSEFLKEHGTLQTFSPIVRGGEKAMPAFSVDQISNQDLANLFAYVRSLTP